MIRLHHRTKSGLKNCSPEAARGNTFDCWRTSFSPEVISIFLRKWRDCDGQAVRNFVEKFQNLPGLGLNMLTFFNELQQGLREACGNLEDRYNDVLTISASLLILPS
jgi:hypothetical protein